MWDTGEQATIPNGGGQCQRTKDNKRPDSISRPRPAIVSASLSSGERNTSCFHSTFSTSHLLELIRFPRSERTSPGSRRQTPRCWA